MRQVVYNILALIGIYLIFATLNSMDKRIKEQNEYLKMTVFVGCSNE